MTLTAVAAASCSRTALDEPPPATTAQKACAAPRSTHACSQLTIAIGPVEVGPARSTLVQAIERGGGLDLLFYDTGSGEVHGIEHLTTSGGVQLGSLLPLTNRVYELARVGDRTAALYPISDAQDYEHNHFQIYDPSYALLSDVDIDDGHRSCTWRGIACDDHRCFATCSSYDGPRFVGFDSNGQRFFGPADENHGAVEGYGRVMSTGCGFVTVAEDGNTSTTTIRFGAPDEDKVDFLLDRRTIYTSQLVAWPYDSSSIAWLAWQGNEATLSRIDSDGLTSVLQQSAAPFAGSGHLVPTSLGLLWLSADQEGTGPYVVTHFDARIIDEDGSVAAEAKFDGGWVIDDVVAGETADGIVIAWNQQRQSPPVTTNDDSINAVLLTCASP